MLSASPMWWCPRCAKPCAILLRANAAAALPALCWCTKPSAAPHQTAWRSQKLPRRRAQLPKPWARAAAEAVGTMGVVLGACTVPADGKPGFTLGEDEIEIGFGIHGEKGVERFRLRPADVLVDRVIDTIVLDKELSAGQRVAILVNGLGGTPPIELTVIARRALARARAAGIVVERLYSGVYLSAIDLSGFSISMMPFIDAFLTALDAPTEVPAWNTDGRVARERRIVAHRRLPVLYCTRQEGRTRTRYGQLQKRSRLH